MSGCNFSVGGDADYDDSPEFQSVSTPKARKQYRCVECGAEIRKGTRYERTSGKFDGDIYTVKTCLVCAEIADAFSEGIVAGELWAEIRECFPALTTGCFSKLETPEAKAFLRERWMKWKGLTQ